MPVMGRPVYYMSDPEDNAAVKRWFLSGPDAGKFEIHGMKIGIDADGGSY